MDGNDFNGQNDAPASGGGFFSGLLDAFKAYGSYKVSVAQAKAGTTVINQAPPVTDKVALPAMNWTPFVIGGLALIALVIVTRK